MARSRIKVNGWDGTAYCGVIRHETTRNDMTKAEKRKEEPGIYLVREGRVFVGTRIEGRWEKNERGKNEEIKIK
jgi:hypothetical protein